METQVIKSKLDQLPDDLKKEKFKFDWEGGLSDLKKKYISVELQHKASEWR